MTSFSGNQTGPVSSSESDEQSRTWGPFLQQFSHRALLQRRNQSEGELAGKRILVTGAGGWIGSALAKSLAAMNLSRIILLDSSEGGLHEVNQTLLEMGGPAEHTPVLASVSDTSAIPELFARYKPEIVFHAAALKHVPLMETNPFAVLESNALGTHILVEAATRYDTRQMVMVSTDKAVAPHSLMGASKRIAELAMLTRHPSSLKLEAVRLGNVLGSSGSVVPLFLRQIARGGPVTVSDPDVSRYFMTLPEAVEALLDAASPASSEGLFVPELGDPVRILDLARHLIAEQQAKINPPAEMSAVPIVFTSLRPGDKLEESLISVRESYLSGPRNLLRAVSSPALRPDDLALGIARLQQAIRQRDLSLLLNTVRFLVPEYHPSPSLREHMSIPDDTTVVV